MRITTPLFAAVVSTLTAAVVVAAPPLTLEKGDRVCIIGNGLGAGLQHHNHFEALLHARFPDLELTVRNLCVPGDEALVRQRPEGFDSPESLLHRLKADVIIYFFGFNESFGGPEKQIAFKKNLTTLIQHNLAQTYNGASPPRIVLVSPTPFEDRNDPFGPDGVDVNANIRLYTSALYEIALRNNIGFVDIFTPMRTIFDEAREPMTVDGVRLTDTGHQRLATALFAAMFSDVPMLDIDAKRLDAVRRRVTAKNRAWRARHHVWSGMPGRTDAQVEHLRTSLDAAIKDAENRMRIVANNTSQAALPDDAHLDIDAWSLLNSSRGEQTAKATARKSLPPTEQKAQIRLAPGYRIELMASEASHKQLIDASAIRFDGQGHLWVASLSQGSLVIFDGANEPKTFASGLHRPTGFELGRGGAYVAQSPDVLFLKDTDGDDRADERVRELAGFGGMHTDALAALEWSPGGALHLIKLSESPARVETSLGVQQMPTTGVWRHEPRVYLAEPFAVAAFTNPPTQVFDRWGRSLIADATPGRDKGSEIVASRAFPDDAQGDVLIGGVDTFRGILRHRFTESGSGFTGEKLAPLLTADDGDFRPVDLRFGPDGALYVCDAGPTHGRVWRITHKDHPPLTPPKIAGVPVADLLPLLKSPEARTRYRVRRELAARHAQDVTVPLHAWVGTLDENDADRESHMLEALWVYQSHHVVKQELLETLLRTDDARVRAAATRVLGYLWPRVASAEKLLQRQINDNHPRVRIEALRAVRFFKPRRVETIVRNAVELDLDEQQKQTLSQSVRLLGSWRR